MRVRGLAAVAIAALAVLVGLWAVRGETAGVDGNRSARVDSAHEQERLSDVVTAESREASLRTSVEVSESAAPRSEQDSSGGRGGTEQTAALPWHFHVGTKRSARRPEGHRIEVVFFEDGPKREVRIFEGRTDAKGEVDFSWAPPADFPVNQMHGGVHCRVVEPGFLPHLAHFYRGQTGEERSSRTYLEPEEGGWILVQIVGPGGEPVPGALLLEQGDGSKTQLNDDFRGRAIVERFKLLEDGHVHGLSPEFGTARMELTHLRQHRDGATVNLECRADGAASGVLHTTGGIPLDGVPLALSIIPPDDDKAPGAENSAAEDSPDWAAIAGGMPQLSRKFRLDLPGDGLVNSRAVTDESGRFTAGVLRHGEFEVVLNSLEWGFVPLGRVSSRPGAPAPKIEAPFAWVTIEGDSGQGRRALYDVTSAAGADDQGQLVPVQRWVNRMLLRSGRTYELATLIDGAERTTRFTVDGNVSPMAVALP